MHRTVVLSLFVASLLTAHSAVGEPTPRTPAHWAFKPPIRPAVPTVASRNTTGQSKIDNPIDSFLLAELRKNHLSFSPEADRRSLIRRLTFDLIGLPPTQQEVDSFNADHSPSAYEHVVDRLLADPRYGERWARVWLDTAGYADSEGILEEDKIRPNAWKYRDYVIRSLNADKRYDQFLREQIAGDEVSDYRNVKKWSQEVDDAVTATGFLRTAVDATRDDFNEHQYAEYQYRMLNDTQTILVSSTLGITLQCARCHDHKYEPFTQRDYYRMQAILSGAIRPRGKLLPTNRRQIAAGTAEDLQHAADANTAITNAIGELDGRDAALIAEYRKKSIESKLAQLPEAERVALVAAARLDPAKQSPAQKALVEKHKALLDPAVDSLLSTFPELKQAHAEIAKSKAAEEKKRIPPVEIRALYDQDSSPPPTAILIRGEISRPGNTVTPGVPAVLDDSRRPFSAAPPPAGASTTGRRTALAAWIVTPGNPLTARVIVNRIWAQHFGVGIVSSVENFGRSGAVPSNQPLLDWLAVTFVSDPSAPTKRPLHPAPGGSQPFGQLGCGWSLKKLHRLIVTSAAYRQASDFRLAAAKADPENRLLWRQRSRRMEAEVIRDSILTAAGTLDSTMYGEPVAEESRPTGEIVPVGEEKGGRRSIYLLVRRSKPVTLLNTFDSPIMETNCTRRATSTTAVQALALMNSRFLGAQASRFAERLIRESSAGLESRVDLAYRHAFNRAPILVERATAVGFVKSQAARFTSGGMKPEDADQHALTDLCQAILGANEFIYVD